MAPPGVTPSAAARTLVKAAEVSAVAPRAGFVRIGQQRRVGPDRLAIPPPGGVQRPARGLLAGIVLAGAILQRGAGRPQAHQPADQLARPPAAWSGPARRSSTPRHPDRGRTRRSARPPWSAARRPACSAASTWSPACLDRLPLGWRVGLGHPRRLDGASDPHLEAELGLRRSDQARDRGGGTRLGRGGERDVALPRQQAAGCVQPDPAGAGQVDLGPGMQVGEVLPWRRAGPSTAAISGLSWIR